MFKHWLSAMRLRTLPLALSSIFVGSFLAGSMRLFNPTIFALACLTTVLLQVLSNLANDYGDSVNGADHAERLGPRRAVQTGVISKKQMKTAIYLLSGLAFVAGLALLWVSFANNLKFFIFFLVLGLLSIVAAITYTAGKKPYGYAGLGDLSVLVFFGWVGVLGSYFLYVQDLQLSLILPATSVGLFAVAVLNINNIRDIDSDKTAGKMSIPVRLGRANAVIYHWCLLGVGLALAGVYVVLNYQSLYQWFFLITLPLFLINARAVWLYKNPQALDPYLKQMALTALQFAITFGLGNLIH